MKTNLERIGVGVLSGGAPATGKRYDHPAPFVSREPIGQHLCTDRLVRVAERRMLYLVDNHSAKWNRRYCWSCGNKYTPNNAKCCDFCMTPLRDLRFLMSSRWDRSTFAGFKAYVSQRIRHRGLLSPVAVLVKAGKMLVVYHYNDEALLVDETAPVSGVTLLRWAYRLSDALAHLHNKGVVLGPLSETNVLIMPDRSARWFDLDVERLAAGAGAVYTDPTNPTQRDIRRLGALLGKYADPTDTQLSGLFQRAALGEFLRPYAFCEAVAEMFEERSVEPPPGPATAFSDVGLMRSVNEDSWGWRRVGDSSMLYVVGDGMGGHDRGEVASALAVDIVCETVSREYKPGANDPKAIEALLRKAFAAANKAVRARAVRSGGNMGTTLVAALIDGKGKAVVLNAGDSRAYLAHAGKLKRVTKDHSVVGELLDQGKITPEQARNHPLAHSLLVWIGGEDEDPDADVFNLTLESADRLLLCSDGLWGEMEEDQLSEVLTTTLDRDEALRSLVHAAYANGGADNFSAILVDVP